LRSVDATSNLTVKWYLDVNVKQGGVGKNDAEVYIQDIFGMDDPATGQPFTTQNDGGPGWVRWLPLTEFIDEGGTRVDHTAHWVNVTAPVNLEGLARPKMWEDKSIVIDLNEVPQMVNLQLGSNGVYRTDTEYFFVNATDAENSENELTVIFQYQDVNGNGWNTTYNGSPVYDGAFWVIDFTPPVDAPTGLYDVRARVQDLYGSYSSWITITDAITVLNNRPDVIDMYNETTDGTLFRGNPGTWVYGDGWDVEDQSDQNFPDAQFQYKRPGENWGDHTQYLKGASEKASDDWRQQFIADLSVDAPIGLYEFRVRFQDTDGEWGDWENLESLEVLNNPPTIELFYRPDSTVYRNSLVRIFAEVEDLEEIDNDLTVKFSYQHSITGTLWENLWLTNNGIGIYDTGSFYVDFNPPKTAELGAYKFRVEVTDHGYQSGVGDTTEALPADLIDVMNNRPVALNIKMSNPTVKADVGDVIYVHVNASDIEDDEPPLQIQKIEWRENNSDTPGVPPTPASWFPNPSKLSITHFINYVTPGGYLRGSIEPKADAYLGMYDIRVSVVDTDTGVFEWLYLFNAFRVLNPEPTLLDVTLQDTEAFRGDTVYIILNAEDPGQDEGTLTVHLEYKKLSASTWNPISVTTDFYETRTPNWEPTSSVPRLRMMPGY
jgi:hypothetical protein